MIALVGQLAIAALATLAPLAAAPERLLHPGPWIAYVAAIVTLVTQPVLSPGEVVSDTTDRRSALGIFVAVMGCQIAAVLQFGYREAFFPTVFAAPVAIGAGLVAAGLTLRVWAIRTLGKFFTSNVRVTDGQVVVDTGPYRVLRHPSYTGTLVHCVGVAVMFASGAALALIVALVVPAYMYRIRVEEAVLSRGLGEAYRAYCGRTWRLVPFIY